CLLHHCLLFWGFLRLGSHLLFLLLFVCHMRSLPPVCIFIAAHPNSNRSPPPAGQIMCYTCISRCICLPFGSLPRSKNGLRSWPGAPGEPRVSMCAKPSCGTSRISKTFILLNAHCSAFRTGKNGPSRSKKC